MAEIPTFGRNLPEISPTFAPDPADHQMVFCRTTGAMSRLCAMRRAASCAWRKKSLGLYTGSRLMARTRPQADSMKAPAEPVLAELTPTGVELLLETYVRWIAYTKSRGSYFAALPMPFIKALMEGHLIDGVGLDRVTGLFHRIDPVLRACLPDGKPTEEEIKQSLNFLLDEWLVDVALDEVGKCVAILLALSWSHSQPRSMHRSRPALYSAGVALRSCSIGQLISSIWMRPSCTGSMELAISISLRAAASGSAKGRGSTI